MLEHGLRTFQKKQSFISLTFLFSLQPLSPEGGCFFTSTNEAEQSKNLLYAFHKLGSTIEKVHIWFSQMI
jgi:hypothetical protein